MKMSIDYKSYKGSVVLDLAVIFLIVVIAAVMLFPVYTRVRTSRKSPCQSNLKELATALQMYWNDYDTTLPSSILHQKKKSKTWDARASAEFCAEYGPVRPPKYLKPQDVHWVQLLWPHIKNKEIVWCPQDPNRPHREGFLWLKNVSPGPHSMVSYFYKPAVDRAWFAGYRKEMQFGFAADQVIFFERCGWHWGDEKKGWRDGVSMNAAFMDGHVRNVRLRESAGCPSPRNASEFTKAMARGGEPVWYNYYSDNISGKHIRRKAANPDRYYDNLP